MEMDLPDLYYDEYDHDYFVDNVDDDYEMFQTQYGNLIEQDWKYTLWDCVFSSLFQIVSYIFNLSAMNILYRLLIQWTSSNPTIKHIYSAVIGFLSTFLFMTNGNFYVLIILILSFLLQQLLCLLKIKKQGFITLSFTIFILVTFELFEKNAVLWHQIRGIVLIAAMKSISYGFDLQNGKIPVLPNAIEFFGYTLCPANTVVGPWCSFTEYKQSLQTVVKITPKFLFQILTTSVLALLFALLSNCIIFILTENSGVVFSFYRDALSFRTSHYFISFMSQIQMMIAGFVGTGKMESKLGYQVTKPFDIELPRSLVTVVISWNIPMHIFIKQYIFQNFKKFGNFAAILTSYVISALLHGLNFQLGSVLLSLGLFSYIEYMLRSQLSEIFSCCIGAHPCKLKENGQCAKGHKSTSKKWFVILVNFLLGIVTLFNLTYLGVMFEASFSIQEKGFSFYHAMSKWIDLKFFGHIFMALSFSIYYILK